MATAGPFSAIKSALTLSGGVNLIVGVGEQYTITASGIWLPGDKATLILTDALTGTQTLIGAGLVSGTVPTYCYTYNQKEYVLAGSAVYFSAVAEPTVFNDLNVVGAGSVTMSDSFSTPENLVSMSVYEGMLAFFSRFTSQIWQVDANPANWSVFQVIPNIGTFAAQSVQSLGGLDVIFLSDTGFRSLRALATTLAAFITDIGSPIDTLVQASLQGGSPTTNAAACSIIDPSANRYWGYLNGVIYVLSYFPANKIVAWATYSPTYARTLTASGTTYPSNKQLTYTTTIGRDYYWVPGAHEVSLVDGANTYKTTISFTATTTTFTVNGTANGATFTGVLQEQTPFIPQVFNVYSGQVYTRDTNNGYLYGGTNNATYDGCIVTAATSWLDLKTPDTFKKAQGLDYAIQGSWQFGASMDWEGVTQNSGVLQAIQSSPTSLPSFQQETWPFSDDGYHIKLQAQSSGATACVLSSMIFVYSKSEDK